ncbi:hypothetical protein ACFLYF_04210 [Chloroflexota bacterium]
MTKKEQPDKNISWDSVDRMEKYLTVRWNNWIAFGVGVPVLIYVVISLSTSALSGWPGYIGIAILGVLY